MSAKNEVTALQGTLNRWAADTWAWKDHTPAPEVKDMSLSWCYNFRCRTDDTQKTYVEVPVDLAKNDPDLAWCMDAGYETSASGDDQGERRIHEDGRRTRHTARDGGKVIREVYLVPAADWDAQPPCGAKWEQKDESAIFAKARSLGAIL